VGTDGVFDGLNTIQGVRVFDDDLNSWTTPDAYGGEVGDPLSQKAYVWNRNNPVAYDDPSGYCAGQTSVFRGTMTVSDGNGGTMQEGTIEVDPSNCNLAAQWAKTGNELSVLGIDASMIIPGAGEANGPEIAIDGIEAGLSRYEQLVKAAKLKYPKSANRFENHHITPKYLGGRKKGRPF
jgi:hypothetical protein